MTDQTDLEYTPLPKSTYDELISVMHRCRDKFYRLAMAHTDIRHRVTFSETHFLTLCSLLFVIFPLDLATALHDELQRAWHTHMYDASILSALPIVLFRVTGEHVFPMPSNLRSLLHPASHANANLKIETTYIRYVRPSASPFDRHSLFGVKRKRAPDEDEA
ncbi:uncharacterized protein LOC62_03G003610 [Vanrija pseudolonga]|uniref:Uncharacterized protein n=1 Tax=Vanrija pseudolonga TaxID=143232 RepID=A0AAF1BKW3_9TREE|nr:hypothetical protein LOC62_03G003610 [Vanrija pseudolonga]